MDDLPRGGVQAGRDNLPELATHKVLDAWDNHPDSDCETRIFQALEELGVKGPLRAQLDQGFERMADALRNLPD